MLTTILTALLMSTLITSASTSLPLSLPDLSHYRTPSYHPATISTSYGLQVISPNTPYIAAAGKNKLYFIDPTCQDPETAQHIKNQIENANIPYWDSYVKIDKIEMTAERRDAKTDETVFVFDPKWVKVLFARGINKRNEEARLEEVGEDGRVVEYDLKG